jgi:hypothetical protein
MELNSNKKSLKNKVNKKKKKKKKKPWEAYKLFS